MKKENITLIIGIALPIIFIIIISLVIYLPSLSINPKYDFIYSINDNNYYYIKDENDKEIKKTYYLYDIENNTSHKIESVDIEKYSLDPGPSSPDGYTVSYGYDNNGIFEIFGSNSNRNGYYISKGNARKRLGGLNPNQQYYYNGSFELIGWIK
ncbi:MAG TPA: hypothetical protein VI775_02195 [Candidatus Paceibacterota bacterium]